MVRARWRAATAWLRTRAVEIAGDHGDDEEEDERDDVLGIGDREGVERRQEEEVEGEHAERRQANSAGQRPQAIALVSTAIRKTSATLRTSRNWLQQRCRAPSAAATIASAASR